MEQNRQLFETNIINDYERKVGVSHRDACVIISQRIKSRDIYPDLYYYPHDHSTDFLRDPNLVLLDLRDSMNFMNYHITGAINFSLDNAQTLNTLCDLLSKNHEIWGPLVSNLHYYHIVVYDTLDLDAQNRRYDNQRDVLFPNSLSTPILKHQVSVIFFRLLLIKSTLAHLSVDHERRGNFCRSVTTLKGGFITFCSIYSKKCIKKDPQSQKANTNQEPQYPNDVGRKYYTTNDKFCLWGSQKQLFDLSLDGVSLYRDLNVRCIIDLSEDSTKIHQLSDSQMQPSNSMIRHLHFTSRNEMTNKSITQILYIRFGDIMNEIMQHTKDRSNRVFICSEDKVGLCLIASIGVMMYRFNSSLSQVLFELNQDSHLIDEFLHLDPWAFYALAVWDLDLALKSCDNIPSIERTNIISSTIGPKYWYFPVRFLISHDIIRHIQTTPMCSIC